MATSTTNYSFTLPEVGGDTDQWGSQLNANWTSLDSTLKTVADSVVDVTLTGNDYLTISGQAITVGNVDLTTDVTGTLPVESGGTGLTSLGSANQVLAVNSTADGLEFQTVSGSGTVTSVAVTGSDGIEIDSGSPVTTSGTIALGINSTTLSTHLGLGSLATQSSVTESQISDLGSYITASSTDTLTNKSGNISQWTNDSGYLTAETNDLTNVSGTLGTGNGGTGLSAIGTANQVLAVNAGATGLEFQTISITESQISDLQSYLTAETNDLSSSVTWANVPDANITQSSVTQHQAALSITESQISDLQTYLTAETNDLSTAVTGTLGTGNGGTGLTAIGTANQVLAVNAGATALEFQTLATGGTVNSVAVSGSDGIEVDSGSPVTSSGTIALGINATSLSTHLGLGTISTQASDSVSITGGSITGVTDIAIADGGTGASTEADARSNLLPSYSGNGSKVLALNSGGTDVEWVTQSQVFTAGVANAFEHANSISDNITVASGNNRLYIGDTTFSGTLTVAGKMVILDGPINLTGTMNLTGTLLVRH